MAISFSLLSIFSSYPELVLASICFLIFLTISRRVNSGLPVDGPVVDHLPYILLHSHHLHDWLADVLRRNSYTFVLKGSTGSVRDIVLTCDPANVNHVFYTNFQNYQKAMTSPSSSISSATASSTPMRAEEGMRVEREEGGEEGGNTDRVGAVGREKKEEERYEEEEEEEEEGGFRVKTR